MKHAINVVRDLKTAPDQGIFMANSSTAKLTTFYDSGQVVLPLEGQLLVIVHCLINLQFLEKLRSKLLLLDL